MLALLLAACTASDKAQQAEPHDAAIGDSPAPGTATAVTFDDSGTVTLSPGEHREIRLTVDPPGPHTVQLALLGMSLDASLDVANLVTDDDGRGAVHLTAPRSATTFRIRATADDGPFDELVISVSADGFAVVLVRPTGYQGRRRTPEWTASAVTRTTCAALPGVPPEDGPIAASAPDGTDVRLGDLPVGPSLAITLRAGKSVGGCRDLADLAAGEVRQVEVSVTDSPVDLASTDLSIDMRIGSDIDVWRQALAADRTAFAETLLPADKSVAATLLDQMQTLAADPASFATHRAAGEWDQLLGAYLDATGVDLREQVGVWIDDGLATTLGGELLTGRITALGVDRALLAPVRFGGLDASEASVPSEAVVSWQLGSKDALQAGGSLYWFPSRLMASAASMGANAATFHFQDAQSGLSAGFGCGSIGDTLATIMPLPSSCDSDCMAWLCETAVAALWARARDASASKLQVATIAFTLSATADISPEAVISGFDGAWAGTYSQGGDAVALKGTVAATSLR